MQGLENALGQAFKKLPQMPESGRKGLANAMPWLALIAGLIALLRAWDGYRLLTIADAYINGLYSAFGYASPISGVTTWGWILILVLVLQAVFLFVAFPGLRSYRKNAWRLVMWADLLIVVYGVIANIASSYFDVFGVLLYIVSSAIGLYFLFQIRPIYTGTMPQGMAVKPTPAEPSKSVKK